MLEIRAEECLRGGGRSLDLSSCDLEVWPTDTLDRFNKITSLSLRKVGLVCLYSTLNHNSHRTASRMCLL